MTTFDPAKALREEITGLSETQATLKKCEAALAIKLSEVEAERAAIINARGLIDAELARKREVLKTLQT
jgi:hypothetical protein